LPNDDNRPPIPAAREAEHDTKPHDVGEWLDGYNRGVLSGRRDVLDLLVKLLGENWFALALIDEIVKALGNG
jgi:hypothetical protein